MNDAKRLLKDSIDEPLIFDRLIDQYRTTRDTGELFEILYDSDDELVRITTWILSEVQVSKYSDPKFKQRLMELTEHENPAIRLHSLNAVFPLLQRGESAAIRLVERLKADENEGVRLMADAAASQLKTAR
jgi:hypothetical protein